MGLPFRLGEATDVSCGTECSRKVKPGEEDGR